MLLTLKNMSKFFKYAYCGTISQSPDRKSGDTNELTIIIKRWVEFLGTSCLNIDELT